MAAPLKMMLVAGGFPEPASRDDKERQIEGFDFSWRQAAQQLGTEWGRSLDPDIWVKIIEQHVRRASYSIVIPDVRYENEAEMVRRMGGKMLFLYGREADLGSAAKHSSESGVEFFPSRDSTIDNSGEFAWTMQQVFMAIGERRA